MLANWTVAIVQKNVFLRWKNAFGRLTANQALGDAIHSTIFGLIYAPMLIFDIQLIRENSQHVGHALLICYDISVYSHLFISLNRFCAIFFPINYDHLFNKSTTTKIIIVTWIVPIVSSFYLYTYDFYRSKLQFKPSQKRD
ncbi:unnamed protein product [Caenorhabditis auriculariae]|uniref:G-protein coupled receptors family 1 profile domain-containing protein n=1 Tax=Caenorhabditis auriculariae TaxID=2777116 RepID=A0A8S1H8Q7_9PELO|nr:unnamed protein product [Caenorhabditis auriculariae]